MGSTSEKALFADPAPPGLSAFAITTFLLSLAIVTNSVVAPNTTARTETSQEGVADARND